LSGFEPVSEYERFGSNLDPATLPQLCAEVKQYHLPVPFVTNLITALQIVVPILLFVDNNTLNTKNNATLNNLWV
jgi:hypothetical protein